MRAINLTLLASTALAGMLAAPAAFAQDDSSTVEEVVVTATRREDVASRVPMSIAAVTQETLDEQGVKTAADLVRFVPGLNTVANPGGGQQTFSIRGIVGATGAATTSVYLDETNLTKRANGGVSQNNGVTIPLLYDLERVEVLKGPQGTLYGGSSQGGTVRFITPTPSLTDMSGRARVEISDMGGRSEESYELGAAIGGPIVQDKLGFRLSGIYRETGGWIDVVSAYTGRTIEEDANSLTEYALRGALKWQIADNFSAVLSGYHVRTEAEGGPNTQTKIFLPGGVEAPAGTTFTTPAFCITNNTRTAPLAQPNGAPAAPFVPVNAACPSGSAPGAVYVRPSYTYGPFTTGKDISLATGRQSIDGGVAEADIASLTLEYDLGGVNVKSITSYLHDRGYSQTTGGEEWSSTTTTTVNRTPPLPPLVGRAGQTTTLTVPGCANPCRAFPLFQPFAATGHTGAFHAFNKRKGVEEELRISSTGDTRLSWVAGIYYSKAETHILYEYRIDPAIGDLVMRLMYGPTFSSAGRYGVVNDQGFQAQLDAVIEDKELAGFAEANYWIIPDKLRATAGVRVSKVELDYRQTNFGQFSSRLPSSIGTLTEGQSSDKPITPKFGLQYQLTDRNMLYATASKGFRAGGVNSQLSASICDPFLAPYGITASEVPASYKPDTVWSYEAGGKFRLLDNKLQLNAALYRIDWSDIQTTITLGCGQGFVTSGGRARSEGIDLQAAFRPIDPLTLTLNVGFTDAFYRDPVSGPLGTGPVAINKGDNFDVPPWQVSASGQYDFDLYGRESYVRLDWTYSSEYTSGASFGSTGYGGNYFNKDKPSRSIFNLRASVEVTEGFEVNAFVLNLFDSDKQIAAPITGFSDGRGQCSASSINCATFSTFNPFVGQAFLTPRRFGLQANYKF